MDEPINEPICNEISLEEGEPHIQRGVFPEFTPSSNFDPVQSRFSWSHFRLSRRVWEHIMLLVSIAIPIEYSFVLVFYPHIPVRKYGYFVIIDLLQLMDNIVIIRTPFLRNGIMVSSLLEILKNYGMVSYIVHVFASIPLGWIGIIMKRLDFYAVLSLNRLLRLHQAFRSYKLIISSAMYSNGVSRMLPHIAIMFFIIHSLACAFYMIAKEEGLENSWIAPFALNGWSQPKLYVVSIYFVLTTIITVGYGDLHPVSVKEVFVSIITHVIGVVFEGFIIAKLVGLLDDPYGADFLHGYESLQHYLDFKGAPKNFHDHVRHYYQHKWELNHGAPDWKELLEGIPKSIQNSVKLELCHIAFSTSDLFKGTRQKHLLMLLEALEPVTFIPGQVIYDQGEMDPDLWLFNSGIIETILDGSSIGTLTANKPFVDSERSLIFNEPRTKTLKAVSFVEGWKLSRNSFTNLVNAKAKLMKLIMTNAANKFPADFRAGFPPGIDPSDCSEEDVNELSSADEWIMTERDESSVSDRIELL